MVIEAHNGEIWVESNNETGATFIFTLPQATAQQTGVAVPNLA
jgi:signal transduction histidine kinase